MYLLYNDYNGIEGSWRIPAIEDANAGDERCDPNLGHY